MSEIPPISRIFRNLVWHPPAEADIPTKVLLGALRAEGASFENTLCKYLGVQNCVLANSGRTLLYLVLDALKKQSDKKRNEVLIPGYTCYSVAASIAKARLKIRVYDIDPTTLHPNLESIKASSSDRILAIVSQHLFGIPANIKGVHDIAKEIQACHIEDVAQALGGTSAGVHLGTTGDFGIYSFGRGKALPVGSGGALIGKDENILHDLKQNQPKHGLIQFTATAAAQLFSKPLLYWIPEMLPLGLGKTVFDPDFEVSAMPVLMKKLADHFMPQLASINTYRCHIAKIYEQLINDTCVFHIPDNAQAVFTRYPVKAGPGPISRELNRLGVRRMYPQAIQDVEAIQPFLAQPLSHTQGASKLAQDIVTLPTHQGINEDMAKIIAGKIITAYQLNH